MSSSSESRKTGQKRKLEVNPTESADDSKETNKRLKPHHVPRPVLITDEFVSASKTRNFVLKDPLLDWLDLYGPSKGFVPDEKTEGYDARLDFKRFIMSQGQRFEALIMSKLRNKFGSELVEVALKESGLRMKQTVELMLAGTPFIAQGMVWHSDTMTHGLPDLLVRSDHLNRLVENPAVPGKRQGCALNPNWHYRVVDIKFSKLHLKANFTTLLNQGSQRAYKVQLCVYNSALAHIQGYDPGEAYVLGRGWEATKQGTLRSSDNPFSKLGVVDFQGDDSDIPDEARQAVMWRRRLAQNGGSWQVLPKPSVPELYPNMCNDSASGWDAAKRAIAGTLKEITLLWQCGPSARHLAHASKVYRWDDPDCSAVVMGINGPKLRPMVDRVVAVNRGTKPIIPDKIASEMYDWRSPGLEFFVDFENVTSIFDLEDSTRNVIYMIGMGWVSEEKWRYKAFVADSLDVKEEERIVREFFKYIGEVADASRAPIRLYHYSHAESSMLGRVFARMGSSADGAVAEIRKRVRLCDLYKLIKEEPVIVKGAMDFSLKSLVSALKEQGKIELSYSAGKIRTGMDGLLAAVVAGSQTQVPFREHELIREAETYNELDCKSLWTILSYLRTNH